MRFLPGIAVRAAWAIGLCAIVLGGVTPAIADPFENGWVLQTKESSLKFQTIKNQTKVESSTFSNFGGAILPDGRTQVEVDLASVDTKVDLRNVRMRFLLFETYVFPKATITAQINSADFADLAEVRRKTISLPYRMSLRGIEQDAVADVSVTLLSDDLIIVSTTTPISIAADTFDLTAGIARLEEAANVSIIPSATVSFDFMFRRNAGPALTAFTDLEVLEPVVATAAVASPDKTTPAQVVEPLSEIECKIRYNVIKQLGPLVFPDAAPELSDASRQMLADVADTINHCPGGQIEIGVHSFVTADAQENRALSETQAVVVRDYLTTLGTDPGRLVAIGYGDAFPRVPQSSARSARINQRVEFSPIKR